MASVMPQDSESFESLLKRFNKKVQHAGILSESRRRSRFVKPPTRNKRKAAARRRMEIKAARKR